MIDLRMVTESTTTWDNVQAALCCCLKVLTVEIIVEDKEVEEFRVAGEDVGELRVYCKNF